LTNDSDLQNSFIYLPLLTLNARQIILTAHRGFRHLLAAEVGKHGSRLSEGEKQRLALAIAIYQNSEVLILDEPSSKLDDATEKILFQHLKGLKKSGENALYYCQSRKIFRHL